MTQSKIMLLFGLGAITLWDAFTTISGTSEILGSTGVAFFLAVLFSIMITTFLIKTIPIMENKKDDFLHSGAKFIWFLAISYDFYTSFLGNKNLIESEDFSLGVQQYIVIIGMTIFVSSAPIIISYILYYVDDSDLSDI